MSYNPISAALDAGTEALEAAADATAKGPMLPDRLLQMETIEAGLTPAEVVYEENKLELLHYQPEEAGIEVPEDQRNEVPILIVYALINRPYILDLQPDRSVVRRLLEAGHDVYLIDWNEPSRLDQHLTLSDYVNRYIDNCVDVVRDRSGQDDINILGYCMGGTMSAMYAALYPEKVNALGLMAAGLCFDETGGVLEQWGSERHFSPRALTGNQGNVPAEMLDHGFALMDPVDNYVSKYVTWYENLENDDFTANFSRMEKWLSEGIDLAGDAYNEFLEKIYQNNELYENELYLDGEHVDIENIDMPVLQIVGEYDHLIPATTSIPFNDVVGSDDVTLIDYPTGHIGMSVSSSTHEDVWPQVGEWYHEVSERDEDETTADTPTEAETGAEADATAETETGEAEADTPTPEVTGEAEAARESVEAVSEAARESVEAGEVPDAAPDLEAVNGIGPTFADRLRDAGIERPSDLLDYEAADLAEIAQTSESRAEDWLDTVLEQF